MTINGTHLLIDLIELDSKLCIDNNAWLEAFKLAAIKFNFHVVGENSHVFSPPAALGMTAFIMLDTSHFSIHTYASAGSAALDLFACTKQDLHEVWEFIKDHLCIPSNCVASSTQINRFTS